jgi:hypothetical protein
MRFACWMTKVVPQPHTRNFQYFLPLTAVRNILWLDNNADGSHCCISLAIIIFFMLLTSTYTPTTIKTGTHCCVLMATKVARKRHNVMYAHCVSCHISDFEIRAYRGNFSYIYLREGWYYLLIFHNCCACICLVGQNK